MTELPESLGEPRIPQSSQFITWIWFRYSHIWNQNQKMLGC